MAFTSTYCFHGFLTVRIVAERSAYIEFFDREYASSVTISQSQSRQADIILYIGGKNKVSDARINTQKTFNGVLTLHYSISDFSYTPTIGWTQDHMAARIAPNFIAPVIQASILEPIMYVKCLQQGILILHAATLAYGQKGMIFAAHGGTGKTSTVLRLMTQDDAWSFLGDDLVFVTEDGTAYNYPRPLHLFRKHVDSLPFLKLTPAIRIQIILRDYLRRLLEIIYQHKFFLAVRAGVRDVLPSAKMHTQAKLMALTLLKKEGETQPIETQEEMMKLGRTILETSDLRPNVFQWFTGDSKKILQEKESELIAKIMESVDQIWEINRDDVTNNMALRLLAK